MKSANYFRTIALAFVAFATVSCSDKETDEPQQQSAITMPSGQALSQTVYADQTEGASVSFTTTGDWTTEIGETATTVKSATAVPGWLSINPASGRAGENTFAIFLEPNYTGTDRSAQITISSGNEKANVTVTQKSTTQDGKPYEKKYDIYTGGAYITGASEIYNIHGLSLYYKNGIAVGDAMSIIHTLCDFTVSGDDVHVVGLEKRIKDGVQSVCAVYKKNGVEIPLPVTRRGNYAMGIDVEGTDVYIAGYEMASHPDDYVMTAKYWKNNVIYLLGDGVRSSYAVAIKATGNDVYVLGYSGRIVNKDEYFYPGYWKNGQFVELETSGSGNKVYDLCVAGQDVYVCGWAWDAYKKGSGTAAYWKNGKLCSLGDANSAYGIAVSGNDVHVVGAMSIYANGHSDGYAVYWKNGERTILGKGAAKGVTVVDNDVYVSVEGSARTEIYKNGKIISTEAGVGNIRRIVVVPHRPTRHW